MLDKVPKYLLDRMLENLPDKMLNRIFENIKKYIR